MLDSALLVTKVARNFVAGCQGSSWGRRLETRRSYCAMHAETAQTNREMDCCGTCELACLVHHSRAAWRNSSCTDRQYGQMPHRAKFAVRFHDDKKPQLGRGSCFIVSADPSAHPAAVSDRCTLFACRLLREQPGADESSCADHIPLISFCRQLPRDGIAPLMIESAAFCTIARRCTLHSRLPPA